MAQKEMIRIRLKAYDHQEALMALELPAGVEIEIKL